MEKIIFFGLVIPIFAFVLYLGVSAIMKGSEANSALKEEANLKNDEDENPLYNKKNLSEEIDKLNNLLKDGVLTPEEFEKATGAEIERYTTKALREAKKRKISGRDVTPFLLKRIFELSKGKSLNTNIALVKNNAQVGADIAIALSSMFR